MYFLRPEGFRQIPSYHSQLLSAKNVTCHLLFIQPSCSSLLLPLPIIVTYHLLLPIISYVHLLPIICYVTYHLLFIQPSCSSNPRNLWKTVNNLLHRGNSNPLPGSIPYASIADSFAYFFTNKVSSLRLSLQTLLPTSTQYDSSSSADKNDSISPPAASFNLFEPAEAEITTLIHASQNK